MKKFRNTYDFLKANDLHYISSVLKKLYKSNPYPKRSREHNMWKEQCITNLPILYLASLYLKEYVKKNGYKSLSFAARDCCHWHKIYSKMFPDDKVTYFRCSRNMFKVSIKYDRPQFKEYVKSCFGTDDRSLYIDIHGTGAHFIDYCQHIGFKMPSCFFLSCGAADYSYLPHDKKKHDGILKPIC